MTTTQNISAAGPVLIDVGTVRAMLGCNAEEVVEMMEARRLRWVWTFSVKAGGCRQDRRFWFNEVVVVQQGMTLGKLRLQTVIARILGERQRFPRPWVERVWGLSAQSIIRLIRAGELVDLPSAGQKAGLEAGRRLLNYPAGPPREIPRASLAAFLERRLC